MNKEENKSRQTFYYKIAALERAIVNLRSRTLHPNCGQLLYISDTESAVLLEAARIGLAKMYEDHSILEKMNWPFP